MGSACLLDLLSCGESKIFISASPLDPLVMRAEGRLKAILTSLVVVNISPTLFHDNFTCRARLQHYTG